MMADHLQTRNLGVAHHLLHWLLKKRLEQVREVAQ
jgi:hypothetical protein